MYYIFEFSIMSALNINDFIIKEVFYSDIVYSDEILNITIG